MKIQDKILPKIFDKIWDVFGNPYGQVLPQDGLILYAEPDDTGISLEVEDYGNIGATWQPVFFTDPATPIVFTYAELTLALEAEPTINSENVIGVEEIGWAVYDIGTNRTILNKALTYFGLETIPPTLYDKYTDTGNYTNLENYI